MIVVEDVHYQYTKGDKASPALKSISLTITEADCLGIIGPNGSGKSTLARCLNGLIQPTEGRVAINGLDTSDPTHSWEIYRQVGMIFQNPDNQLISTTVERE
ncbi:MAG: ATP-binding cassette domain-containing protein, partial [Candidatus Latescibacteria bacterium]|nr:ATP-binding cassette domain-containing protein [Candidatus Latescibacterota bacterium]